MKSNQSICLISIGTRLVDETLSQTLTTTAKSTQTEVSLPHRDVYISWISRAANKAHQTFAYEPVPVKITNKYSNAKYQWYNFEIYKL